MTQNSVLYAASDSFVDGVILKNLAKMFKLPLYKFFLVLCGLPLFALVGAAYVLRQKQMARSSKGFNAEKKKAEEALKGDGALLRLEEEVLGQLQKKYAFLNKNVSAERLAAEQKRLVAKRFDELVLGYVARNSGTDGQAFGFVDFFFGLLKNPLFFGASIIIGFPMYVLVLFFSNPYVKYIFERLVMMVLVLLGVVSLVFTMMYFSPTDPAVNLLGLQTTPELVAQFNQLHGLDRPFFHQLFDVFRGVFTFDMGISFVGNENVIDTIFRLFPITLALGLWSLLFAMVMAVPAGIFSAIKPYSAFDYVFMFIALLGLSIPNFWQGLVFILVFSINLGWLPPLRVIGDWTSLIMPVVVLGTSMAALVARMIRTSMLEVIKQDYITTARAKGLSNARVVIKHVLGNALIPVVTVIGITFGALLSGSAVIERVFNIRGLGSHMVDRQFVPDVPVIMAITIYIALVLSLANLFVDVLYAFLDPRIKSQMKNY